MFGEDSKTFMDFQEATQSQLPPVESCWSVTVPWWTHIITEPIFLAANRTDSKMENFLH